MIRSVGTIIAFIVYLWVMSSFHHHEAHVVPALPLETTTIITCGDSMMVRLDDGKHFPVTKAQLAKIKKAREDESRAQIQTTINN